MKITKNFSYWEFGPKGCSKRWIPDNEYQDRLIKNLAQSLQILRDCIKVPIDISSGMRTMEDYYRLQGEGYNPSETSDHFFGTAIATNPAGRAYKKFGNTYNFSVGAVDATARGIKVHDFFIKAMKCHNEKNAKFGQVIYEKNPARNVEWVHIGGNHSDYLSPAIVSWLGKKPFLKSLDNGKTYQVASL
jgi:hypothetical protein